MLAKLSRLQSLKICTHVRLDLSPLAIVAVATGSQTAKPPVRGLTRLIHLEATGRAIQNVEALGTLVKLEEINLSDSKVADLAPLATLTQLKRANLSRIPATKFDAVRHWTKLTHFNVAKTAFDDWRLCAGMTSLVELVVDAEQAKSLAKVAVLDHLPVRVVNIYSRAL